MIEVDETPTIFIYGLDDKEEPRLGTFTAGNEVEAIAAAKRLGWDYYKVSGRRLNEIAERTQPGNLSAFGYDLISITNRLEFDRFLCAANITGYDGIADHVSGALLAFRASRRYFSFRDEVMPAMG